MPDLPAHPPEDHIDPVVAAVLRKKTGLERMQLFRTLWHSVRDATRHRVRLERPHWSDREVNREAGRRMLAGE